MQRYEQFLTRLKGTDFWKRRFHEHSNAVYNGHLRVHVLGSDLILLLQILS